jgi:hypothetical protein
MKQKPSSRRKHSSTKSILRLPDLEHAKAAVLNSLNSADAERGYRHAINELVDWYCSEHRLAFNRTVVLRYRSHLESRQLASGTINLRLDAVRRLAYEAADCNLLSADLAAGVRRVTRPGPSTSVTAKSSAPATTKPSRSILTTCNFSTRDTTPRRAATPTITSLAARAGDRNQ